MTVRVVVVEDVSDERGARLGSLVRLTDEPGWWKITGANLLNDGNRAYQLLRCEHQRQRGQRTLTLRPKPKMEEIMQVKHVSH
jgi:hypothetical protein